MKYLLVVVVLIAGGFNARGSHIKGRLLTPEEGCGFTSVGNNRIVGGYPAKIGVFPWMALIAYNAGAGIYKFECGGSLITSRHVLTAAHCVKPTLSFVRLGEHDLRTLLDGPHQDVRVARHRKHSNYSIADDRGDIAILYLGRDVEFSDRIRPICLPVNEPILSESFIGSNPFIAGWGTTRQNGKLLSDVLMQLQVSVHESSVCTEAFRQRGELPHENQFDSSVLCAGNLKGGEDSCQGDSGGPLMLPLHVDGKFPFYQIGVVSFGIGCGVKGIPAGYTSVQHFVDWIQLKLKQ